MAGHADAQVKLGHMYFEGRGVPQDYQGALRWYLLAATQGNAEAVQCRDEVAEKMTPVQIAEAQRLAREWEPKKKP